MRLLVSALFLFAVAFVINANPLLSRGHGHHAPPPVAPAEADDTDNNDNPADVMDIISKFLADSTEDGGDDNGDDGGDDGNNFCDAYGGCGSVPSENIYAPSAPIGYDTYQSQYPIDQGNEEPSGDEEEPFDVSFSQTSQSTSKQAKDKIINFNFIDQTFDIKKNKKK